MRRLAIIGASGHGQVIAEAAVDTGWENIVFFDDNPLMPHVNKWDILGSTNHFIESFFDYDGVVVGIGNNSIRLEKTRLLVNIGAKVVNILHPSAFVSQNADLLPGTVVFANAVINTGVKIGLAGLINSGATVDHHCALGDGVHISPGVNLGGNVTVGNETWVGIGSSVIQNVKIGCNSIVGAGSVIIKNVMDNVVVVGNPGRVIRTNNK